MDTAKYWVGISVAVVSASLIFWLMWGLNLGIDFTGGSSMELSFPDTDTRPSIEQVQKDITNLGISAPLVRTTGESGVALSMQEISNDQRQQIIDKYADKQVVEESFSSVGPTLGN